MTGSNRKRAGAAMAAKANERAAALAPILRELRATGITSTTELAARLNARRIPAPRGGKWGRMQVWRLLKRLEHGAE